MHSKFPFKITVLAALAVLGCGAPVAVRAAAFPPLNQPAATQQFPGKFIWGDLFTSEPATAAAFYCGLFGWTASQVDQHDKSYLILRNGDHPVAGIVERASGATPRPGLWIGYISVAKAKTVLAGVAAAGGHEHAPVHKFPDRGYQAIFSDSEGAVVGILQSTSGDPADEEPRPGDWNWFELYAQKPETAGMFYRKVVGYEVNPDTRTEKSEHLVFSRDGHARAGVAPLPAGPDSRPGWLGCIRVADIDAAAAHAVALGGKVLVAPRPAALGSRFAVVADPTGGAVGLVQYVDNANPGDRP